VLPVLLRRRPVGGGRPAQPAHAGLGPGRGRAVLLRRLGALARGQPAEVPLQDSARAEAAGPAGPGGAGGGRPSLALQWVLGPVAPHQLPGRDPDGGGADAGAGASARPVALALPALLRGAAFPAPGGRRSALRPEVRQPLAGLLPAR